MNESKSDNPALAGLRVLVMDDNEDYASKLKRSLATRKVDSVIVSDGDAVIEAYRAAMHAGNPFDIVLLDLKVMGGGMNGDTAMKELIRIDPGVSAIVASGDFTNPVMHKFREFGFKGIVEKPFFIDELLQTIQLVLVEDV